MSVAVQIEQGYVRTRRAFASLRTASTGSHAQKRLSNSWCGATRALYAGQPFVIHEVSARRNINSKGAGRGAISEALIVAAQTKGG